MKIRVTFYDPKSGSILSIWSGPRSQLEANTPSGAAYIDGHLDPNSYWIDPATGDPVSLARTPPSDDHVWDSRVNGFRLADEVGKRLAIVEGAKLRIAEIESKQSRCHREFALDPLDVDAKRRLQEIDAEIRALRTVIRENSE